MPNRTRTLDKAYKKFIQEIQKNESKKERVEIYNFIVEELIKNNKSIYFEELIYRLTDGENPNKIIIEFINRDEEVNSLIWFVEKRIEVYLEEDFYSRFYNFSS